MKIACLYVDTGRYTVFWRDFYLSAEKYFITEAQKDYFLFTDNEHIDFEEKENVIKIYQNKLGWPYDTLMRFDIFLSQEEKLKEYDYIFFFNANLEFEKTVATEVLPTDENDGLVVCMHPGFYNKKPEEYDYDRNQKSEAYIPLGHGKYYVAGGLNGGAAHEYLKLCRECSVMVHKDLDNNIIPLWHDESVLNKYVLNKKPLILDCRYLYPEGKNLRPFKKDIKILIRDKANPKYGGHAYLRGDSDVKVTTSPKITFNFLGIRFSFKKKNYDKVKKLGI